MSFESGLCGEPGWSPVNPVDLVGSLQYVSGEPNGDRLRLRYFRDDEGDLVARIWFGPGAAGPPGHAHGGSIAAVFDEVLGLAAWASGYPIVVANLHTDFRAPLPLEIVATLTTSIESINGRKINVCGQLVGPEGTVYAEGKALLIVINPDAFAEKNRMRGCV